MMTESEESSHYLRKRARLDTSQSSASPSLFSDDISSVSFGTSEQRSFSSSTSSVVIERLPIPAIKIKKVGKDAKRFKPINRNRMYWKIVKNPNELQPIINEWIFEYQLDGNALFAILQLIIDVMGYQSFDVEEAFFDWQNINEISSQLEELNSVLQMDFQCVLVNRSSYCKSIAKTYFNFIYYLMKTCSSCNIVYDYYFLDKLLKFLLHLTESNVRVVRHSAVITVLVVKLCSELISIMQEINEDEEKQAYIHSKINSCLAVYYLNCRLSDSKMSFMRTSCLNECNKWIDLAPNLMINKKSIAILKRMLLDMQPVIRISALTTIRCLIPNLLLSHFDEQDQCLSRLINEVENRLVDVNQDVIEQAILAIYEHTKNLCIERRSEIRNYIFKCIYVENRNIARAAGNYLYFMLSEALPEEFLKKIVLFNSTRETSTVLLVDALIDIAREFQNLDFILEYLYDNNGEFTENEENKLMQMFYYAAKFLLTGEFDGIANNRKTEAAILAEKYEEFIEHFVPKIKSFIEQFKFSNDGLNFLLQSILLIDFSKTNFIRVDVIEITNSLFEIFETNTNDEILHLINTIFSKLTNEYCSTKNKTDDILLNYFNTIIESYTNIVIPLGDLSKITSEESEEIKSQLRLISLFSKHYHLVNIAWEYIYYDWNISGYMSKILKYQVVCCQNYLFWQYKNVDENDKILLDQKLEKFIDSSIGALQQSSDVPLQVSIFNCLHNLAKTFFDTKIDIVKFKEPNDQVLLNFVLKHCFQEETPGLLLNTKRNLLKRILNLCSMDSINSTALPFIYAYYTAENYIDIFEEKLKQLESRSKCVIILCVLKYFLDSGNLEQLKLVGSKFAKILENSSFLNLFQLLFQYINSNENNSLLLKHMIPFVKKMKVANKRELKIFIDEKIGQPLHENVAIKQFVSLLR